MIEKIKEWLQRPYPFPTTFRTKILISLGIGLFVYLFFLTFKPFDITNLSNNRVNHFAIIYGVVTALNISFSYFIIPNIFTNFYNQYKWNVGKMIISIIITMIPIGISNWIVSDFSTFYDSNNVSSFMFFQQTVFLLGIFPILIYIYFTESFINNSNKTTAKNISLQKENVTEDILTELDNPKILLIGENKKEELTIYLNDLIYINSEKNYASIYHLHNNKIKETLLRISLNKIENQLANYPTIIRCHKSYIVNTYHVEEILGNARGYLLKIANLTYLIPVSRSFPKDLLPTLVK